MTTVAVVSVGVETEAVVVVGVTIVELVSVGETSVVPLAAIGAVSDVAVSVDVSNAAVSVVEAPVSTATVSVFSASSRLQATARATQRTTRISLRMEQLSFAQSVRQKMGPTRHWLAAHADLLSMLLLLLGIARILSTLTVFSATSDEGLHVTAGLQLVQEGRYAWQLENPPLPRVIWGTLVQLSGAKFDPAREPMDMVRWMFYSSGHYKTALFWGRAGNVLFFAIAALATWWLARRSFGRGAAAMAMLLFTTQPVILGYSGIANFDAAATAGFAVALLAFQRWLEQQTPVRALVAGAAYGFSIGLKFSNLLFVAVACVAMYLVHRKFEWRRALIALPLAVLATFVALWACYGFSFGSIASYDLRKPQAEESVIGRMMAPLQTTTPIPMPHFFIGLSGIAAIDSGGFHSYAFEQRTHDGWWWYFPAALLFKTTLALLILVIAGCWLARGKLFATLMAAVVAVLAVSATSSLDLGVRYVLPLYVPLTVAAAAAAWAMLQHANRRWRIAAMLLLTWQCLASVIAHPDYFPYFNELGARDPGRFFVDSNLDWGQDMLRLRRVLREKKVDKIGISAAGLHDYDKLGFPPWYFVEPGLPTQGWIAVSEHVFRMTVPDGGFWWLRGRPYQRVGASIRLYFVP